MTARLRDLSKRELAARALSSTGIGRLIRAVPRSWQGLLVFNYHRLGDTATTRFNPCVYSASVEDFDAQVAFFKKNFDIVGPADLPAITHARGRFVQLTFDDGYRDNHDIAFPVLQRHGATATFFIATGYIDAPHVPWWDELAWMVRGSGLARLRPSPRLAGLGEPLSLGDEPTRLATTERLRALHHATALDERSALLDAIGEATGTGRCSATEARELWMTWDMIRAMARGGMSLGGHTVEHTELSALSLDAQLGEIRRSKLRLEEQLGARTTVFAFPFGSRASANSDTTAALAAAGIDFAYSYYGGYQLPGRWAKYDLRRVAVKATDSRELIAAIATAPQLFARPRDRALFDLRALRALRSLRSTER